MQHFNQWCQHLAHKYNYTINAIHCYLANIMAFLMLLTLGICYVLGIKNALLPLAGISALSFLIAGYCGAKDYR